MGCIFWGETSVGYMLISPVDTHRIAGTPEGVGGGWFKFRAKGCPY